MAPWLWLILAIAALVGESATMALYLLYFGVAAFIVAALALLGLVPVLQFGAFLILSAALIGIVRPRTLHRLGRSVPRGMLTNQGVRPDQVGTVMEDVSAGGGMIRLGAAEFWTARPFEPGMELKKGTQVHVVFVDGLTAFVEPMGGKEAPGEPRLTDGEPAPGGALR